MTSSKPDRSPRQPFRLVGSWWFLPAFIAAGQLLIGATGYRAWAQQAGQEFMLSFMFYMSLLGVCLGGECMLLLRRLLQQRS